ncbi:MAG: YfhO family protein [Lachnospiraceae bacterium]|nr:YfhO family protein [Lachnospiraceae bacterium]
MVYIRRLLINYFTALVHKESFVFPMIDFTIGMGDDTIAALNYYGLGDPFYFLTMLVSEENLPYFYSVFFYFRVYLGGIAFILFVFELDNTRSSFAYVIGALVYSFSGFTAQSNMHIIFVHAMFYIPLMLLGAERSMREKKNGMLCITTFCFALSGFFLYIASIALVVYVIYQMFREKRSLPDAIKKICRLLMEYGLGLGLSAVIFIPAVLGFLSSNRAQIMSGYPLISSWNQIKNILLNMFQPSYDNLGQESAVCTIGMIVIICILLAKGRVQEKKNLALLFLITIIPFFDYFMSGFGRSYSRWQIVISMYMAFLTVLFWDELECITTIQKMGLVLIYLLLCAIGKRNDILAHERFGKTILSYGVILITLLIILPLLKKIRKAGKYVLFFVTYITICINWKAIAGNRDIRDLQLRQVLAELVSESEEAFYRIDDERGRERMNLSLCQGYCGTMQYVSIANNRYVNAFEKWGISHATHMTWYGLDHRTVLEAMCAVKYFIVRTEHNRIVPYGFEYVKSTEDGEWSLYENQCQLPIAYAYDKVYNVKKYQEMSGIEKQQVMLQAAVVEKLLPGGDYETDDFKNELYTGTYEITGLENVTYENGIIEGEKGGVLTISTEIKSDCENYLVYMGESDCIERLEMENEYGRSGGAVSPLVFNLGTAKEDQREELKITFGREAAFEADKLQVMFYDLSGYQTYIQNLKKDTDGKFKVGTNRITGTVELEQDKIMCFSVPYSLGWHVKIDGAEIETYPVNDLFVGIEVPEGVHEIEAHYVTPGIKVGAAVSIISLIAIVIGQIWIRLNL